MREHLAVLGALGADAIPVRRVAELDRVDGLVIPGGESSVIDKLSRMFGMADPIGARIASGMPVYGTCAGLIMLADEFPDMGVRGPRSVGGTPVTINVYVEDVDAVFKAATEAGATEVGGRQS